MNYSTGDVHGQFYDLLRLFQLNGYPPEMNYLFLGYEICIFSYLFRDYVDRGSNSIEILCLLFALKVKYPNKVFLLRGNHETDTMNQLYGFCEECYRRYSPNLYSRFSECFRYLPLCALIGTRIFCTHGGLSPYIRSLSDIASIERPYDVPDEGLVCDLLWSDPKRNQTERWCPNERGVSYTFSEEVVFDFLEKFHLDLVCRAHQVVDDGYEFFADTGLLTIFSAPNYGGMLTNSGAMLSVDGDLLCTLHVLRPLEAEAKYFYNPQLELEDGSDDSEEEMEVDESSGNVKWSVCWMKR